MVKRPGWLVIAQINLVLLLLSGAHTCSAFTWIPMTSDIVYANHPRGFALASMRSPILSRKVATSQRTAERLAKELKTAKIQIENTIRKVAEK